MTNIYKPKLLIFQSLLLAVFALAFLSGCGRTQELSTQELLNHALKEASKGEWDVALGYLETATDREPDNVAALVFKAIALEGCDKYELALNVARKAAKISPKNFWAQYTLGRLYSKELGKMQDAVSPLLRALQLKPGDANTLLLLGRCSSALKLDSAIKYYKELSTKRQFKKRAELWNEMAIYYAERGQVNQAASCIVKAYKLAPSNPMIVLNFATFVDQYAKDPKMALKYYRKFLRLTMPTPSFEAQYNRVKARIEKITSNG